MAYIKIVLALLVWGVLIFYGGSIWLDDKREQTCTSEIAKDEPNLDVVKERCTQTAESYMKNENYGSASWFYLLGGEVDKNLNEVEAKITDGFYMNIGHAYLLKGNYEKAKEIYAKYPWEAGSNFYYADEIIQPDFVILPKLYKDKKENIAKGLAIWNEIYEPIGKIVKAGNAYEMAVDDENRTEQIKYLEEYLEYAKPYKEKRAIDYIEKKKELASLYSLNEQEGKSIEIYKELADVYENNASSTFDYIDTMLSMADSYSKIRDYNSSLEYHKKALALTLDSNDSDEQPLDVNIIYSNMGDVYKEMNQSKEAIAYYTHSLKYIESHDANNYGRLSDIYSDIAEVYFSQKDYNAYKENYTKSIALKKEELKNSEGDDYYRDYIFSDLEELYSDLADGYISLNRKKKAREIEKQYISFLEYEYETHYRYISMAYHNAAKLDINSSIGLENQLQAIKYMEKSVETEFDSQKELNNEDLVNYIYDLKEYVYAVDKNRTRATKSYIKHVESLVAFEKENFEGEEQNNELLKNIYTLLSDSYNSINDEVNSLKYKEKASTLLE